MPFLLWGPREEESGQLGEHPLSLCLIRPVSPSLLIPTTPSLPDLLLLPFGGCSLRPPQCDPRGVALHLPQANFVHFASPFCVKLREMGRVGDPRPPRTFPKPGRPWRSLRIFSFFRRGRRFPGTKAATPRPRQPGARWLSQPPWSVRHRGSLPTPFPALRFCPGGGWGAAGAAVAELGGPSTAISHHLRGLQILCWAGKSLGSNLRTVGCASGKGSGGWWGGTSSPLLCIKGGVCLTKARSLPWQCGAVWFSPPGRASCWGGSSGSFFLGCR